VNLNHPSASATHQTADLFPSTIKLNPLFGRLVTVEAPCPQCTSTTAIIRDGKAMHAATLVCAGCGRFRQWISHADFTSISKFVSEIADRFGCPEAISFRAITRVNNREANPMSEKKYENSNGGVLFKNTQKQSDKHADYRGEVNAGGLDYWVDGWIRKSKKGTPFISFKLKLKDGQAAQAKTSPAFNDEIGF
jgi:hypothetical protein